MNSTPSRSQIALRGVLVALVVAAVIALIVFGAAQLMGAAVGDGVKAATAVGLSYLVVNLVVLAAGLVFRAPGNWAVGAALATPVIVAAIGFGYTIFLAYPL
jgi:hypothetical protein